MLEKYILYLKYMATSCERVQMSCCHFVDFCFFLFWSKQNICISVSVQSWWIIETAVYFLPIYEDPFSDIFVSVAVAYYFTSFTQVFAPPDYWSDNDVSWIVLTDMWFCRIVTPLKRQWAGFVRLVWKTQLPNTIWIY